MRHTEAARYRDTDNDTPPAKPKPNPILIPNETEKAEFGKQSEQSTSSSGQVQIQSDDGQLQLVIAIHKTVYSAELLLSVLYLLRENFSIFERRTGQRLLSRESVSARVVPLPLKLAAVLSRWRCRLGGQNGSGSTENGEW